MRTILIALVTTFSLSACGVDSPSKIPPDKELRSNQMIGATDGTAAQDPGGDGAESCDFTIDCDVGMCDLVTHTCFGDDPIPRNANEIDR